MPSSPPPAARSLDAFAPATRAWFAAAFDAPTPVQTHAWAANQAGAHTLVIAPTGSGKTLAAFLHAIDQLFGERQHTPDDAPAGTRVLYISPIKALGADVQRNLQIPLLGVNAERERRGDPALTLSVGIRSGDTPAADRARLVRRPPDILITTPESLFLMLTSKARETLRTVHTVIIDEIHAVAGTKRGTHLALSLERLDALLPEAAQRIGLSATVRPVEQVADFLGGDRPVTVVNPPSTRQLDVRIVVPVEDMADIPARAGDEASGRVGSIWPHVEASILDQVLQRRSTIVFANSRGVAEKLTARLNELYAERMARDPALQRDPPTAADGAQLSAHYASSNGGTSGRSTGADPLIARSHHGSVSKEQRRDIEQALKSGELRCVVATSSLELGIDMGLVDLVIQVAAPPSVASALQRVGRASHQVGGVSTGLVYPRTRRDLIDATVAVEGMLAGRIEAVDPPRNPLDVLAQQTVAAAAMDTLDVDAWYASVRRAAPYRTLPRSAFDATLDMLAGRYPSDDFAGFRPRLVWNRETGELSARPGAKQLAVTSGGTIPDRGMFSVMLPEGEERAGSRRVGELDEEMVHESRVNDVITLGATSWRIEQITHDQVVVTPAPGRSARLPFWRGEGVGRPAELGAAVGAFLGALDANAGEKDIAPALLTRLQASGLASNAIANMLGLVGQQRAATGLLPTDRRLVVERCRDESGDWRVMLHSPYGRRVHDPWALALAGRICERWGVDPAVVASDDGIIARIPDSTGRLPGAELFLFDPVQLRSEVARAVGGSALFAARFRECAARALLLPRRTPGRRSPLWQQRLRAGELLAIAQRYPDFPILIEAARECLQDVYDLDALAALMQRLAEGGIEMAEVTTEVPSPFAANLLFGYVAEFMYGTDVPLAERRASVLSLDSGLLADLLGQVDLGELLDATVVQQVGEELQRRAPGRRAKGKEGIADLLRELGPLSAAGVAARLSDDTPDADAYLQALERERRAIRIALVGVEHWAAIEDATRLRDALGVRLPDALPEVFLQPSPDPLGELLARYARRHAPFTTAEAAAAFGLGVVVADAALDRLEAQGSVLKGTFGVARRWHAAADAPADLLPLARHEWVGEDVLRRLRMRSLQAARQATRPVPGDAYALLLLERHGLVSDAAPLARVAPASTGGALEGIDGVARVIELLAGVPAPASVWESQILPARVRDYTPALLDELLATGTVVWSGHGRLGEDDGLVSLHLQEYAFETLPAVPAPAERSPLQQTILQVLAEGGAYFARQLAAAVQARLTADDNALPAVGAVSPDALHTALWELVWMGYLTTDIWTPLRGLAGIRPPRPRAVRTSRRSTRVRGIPMGDPAITASGLLPAAAAFTAPTLAGRWSLLHRDATSDTVRAVALAEGLLDRHGIVTRGAAVAEDIVGGFPALQQVYRGMEDAGRVLRGRFVDKLGGAQFAERTTVDRLRGIADALQAGRPSVAVALSVVDPANPFGTVLPWPAHAAALRPVRRGGALVVIVGGRLQMYLAQGGRQLLTWFDADASTDAASLALASSALATALGRIRRTSFTLDLINDAPVARDPLTEALRAAGFRSDPKGLRWEG